MGACRREVAGSDSVGMSCPDCGHSTLVHPGFINPALDECALCALLLAISDALRDRAGP